MRRKPMNRPLRLLSILAVTLSLATAQQKKRVAVLDFDYATVHSNASALFGTNVDVGRGIADLLVEKLVTGGNYSVIERKAIDKIMAEQNFSNSDRADSSSAARIGKLLGVEAIIIGSITQFGRDDKSTGVAGGAVGRLGGRFGIGGVQKNDSKAVVGISARMVSTDTAEILGVANGKGESKRTGASLAGAGGGSVAGLGGVDMTSKNFAGTLIGEAVTAAVAQLATQLDQSAARLPTRVVKLEGVVADASGDTIILNIGSKAGVKVGDRLEVRRKLREVRDPATGKVIRSIADKIGEAAITEVDESSAVGKYTGASPAKVGDTVRSSQ